MGNYSMKIKPRPTILPDKDISKPSSDYMKMPNKPCPMPKKPNMPPMHKPHDNKKLAHAYIPWQYYGVVYSNSEALKKGTLFPELYMPYKGGGDKYDCSR